MYEVTVIIFLCHANIIQFNALKVLKSKSYKRIIYRITHIYLLRKSGVLTML